MWEKLQKWWVNMASGLHIWIGCMIIVNQGPNNYHWGYPFRVSIKKRRYYKNNIVDIYNTLLNNQNLIQLRSFFYFCIFPTKFFIFLRCRYFSFFFLKTYDNGSLTVCARYYFSPSTYKGDHSANAFSHSYIPVERDKQ